MRKLLTKICALFNAQRTLRNLKYDVVTGFNSDCCSAFIASLEYPKGLVCSCEAYDQVLCILENVALIAGKH